jgi:NADH dehydrogenase
MPMPLAKVQAALFSLMPKPLLTKDQCEILNEADNIVSNNHLTLKDLKIEPNDVQQAMPKWLWRFRSGGEFSKKI